MAAGEMLRGRQQHMETLQAFVCVPPIQFDHFGKAPPPQESFVAQRRHDQGVELTPQPRQRREVHVVVVIVADEHRVDARELLKWESRRPHAARPGHVPRPDALGVNRVGQQVQPAKLHQERRVADERRRNRPWRRLGRFEWSGNIRDPLWPAAAFGRCYPQQIVKQPVARASRRVLKATAVEMRRRFAAMGWPGMNGTVHQRLLRRWPAAGLACDVRSSAAALSTTWSHWNAGPGSTLLVWM